MARVSDASFAPLILLDAITIQHSLAQASQKDLRCGANVNHEYGDECLDASRIAKVYFTSNVDAKERMRDLNILMDRKKIIQTRFEEQVYTVAKFFMMVKTVRKILMNDLTDSQQSMAKILMTSP